MQALVLITGASSGIGAALATSVPFPARVIGISRTEPLPRANVEHIAADLGDPRTWPRVVAAFTNLIVEVGPERSVFIHNAATITPIGHVSDLDEDAYTRNVLLNSAAGQVLGMGYLRAVSGLPGDHDLVMVSSGAATRPIAGWAAYCAGKAALEHWVRTVGLEQSDRGGVRVSAIAPGVVDTGMQSAIRAADASDFSDVAIFRQLKEDGKLLTADEAASRMWAVIESGLESGAVTDIRES